MPKFKMTKTEKAFLRTIEARTLGRKLSKKERKFLVMHERAHAEIRQVDKHVMIAENAYDVLLESPFFAAARNLRIDRQVNEVLAKHENAHVLDCPHIDPAELGMPAAPATPRPWPDAV